VSDEKPPENIPLPPMYDITADAIERWGSLPSDQPIEIVITKPQLDQLMLGLRRSTLAQMELGNALRAATNNDMKAANEFFISHQMISRESYSNFNRFIEAVMQNSHPVDNSNG
jgi:hypothetical protein